MTYVGTTGKDINKEPKVDQLSRFSKIAVMTDST